jgi:hypothetical protein
LETTYSSICLKVCEWAGINFYSPPVDVAIPTHSNYKMKTPIDAKALREKIEGLYKGKDLTQDDKKILVNDARSIASKEAHTNPEFKRAWYEKTLSAANDPTRVKAISDFNKKNSKFKDPAIREKSRKIKQDNGSYISPEIAAPIYCDPEFWGKDRYYGAARKMAEKYNISEARAHSIRDNTYGFEPVEKHEYWISVWKETVAVRWCISTPGPGWLGVYDEQCISAIKPSEMYEARFKSDDPVNFLLSNYPDRLAAKTAKGVKDAKASALWIYSADKQEVAESAVEKLLDSPKAPSIIFTSNNDMLLAVLKVAGERGLTIGKDISVVSFDDSPWAAAMVPGITVIARPVEDLGHIAVTELVEAIEGNTKAKEIVLPASLIKRGSVAKLTKSK